MKTSNRQTGLRDTVMLPSIAGTLREFLPLVACSTLLSFSASAHDSEEAEFFETISPTVASRLCELQNFLIQTGMSFEECGVKVKVAEKRCLALVSPISFPATEEELVSTEARESYAILYRFCLESVVWMQIDTIGQKSEDSD